ncbi:MAG TPA: acetylxylan esterase [Chthonomonadaceae bacterium]|nr:acetylxylan esterase [Chthonomonadaceae bacterium]
MPLRSGLALLLAATGLVLGAPGAPTMPARSQIPSHPTLPTVDTRAVVPPSTLDTPRGFPAFHSLAEWEARRAFIRAQILVSCGLYPLPPRTPLKAKIFGRIQRDGYTIEKVALQTYPGFYLAGNLYRPSGPQKPPYPGVLVAHGHWPQGRMADTPDGSIPARAITFARQGYVAFTYDMVGYNDTRQIDHAFGNDRRHWLWGVTLMGLQTWNSIRALDFLASLPDVDSSRLAITGESGGGTQTMILGALDDRLAAVGPCVMVSHTMQGGCLCENAPGLRIDFSNMEIAAAAAPRPQVMVAATGDWTKTMMRVEGPAVESVYKLYGAPDHLKYVIYDYGHNINKTSREAVYAFFGRWLLHQNDGAKFAEPPYTMEPVENLRVFPDGTPLPPDAKDAEALTRSLIVLAQSEIERYKPHDRRSLTQFQKTFLPAWQHTLAVEMPAPDRLLVAASPRETGEGYTLTRLNLGRNGRSDNVPAALFLPERTGKHPAIVLAHPEGMAPFMDTRTGQPGPLVRALLEKGRAVLLLDAFLTGSRADAAAEAARKPFERFFTTYNRTDLQERVQDLITACAYLRSRPDVHSVAIAGQGRAGLWALLAAPVADAVAADCARLDLTTDDALLADDLFTPCLRRLGDFATAAVLVAPHPLLLHDTGDHFTAAAWIDTVYKSLGAARSFRQEKSRMTENALVSWLAAI